MIENPRQLDRFKQWLKSGGAAIEEPKSEWEYLRYVFGGSVHLVYRNKKGGLTFQQDSQTHFDQWQANHEAPH